MRLVPPAPLNLDLVRHRLGDIKSEVGRLRGYAAMAADRFVADGEKVRAARYALIVAVEAAAAVCNHLCTRLGRIADSYPGCFIVLGELGIVEPVLASRLAALARLRNLLVHGYARVDDHRLHELLQTGLADLEAFVTAVGAYARRESDGPE